MGTVFGNSAGRANIVWFEGSSDLPVSSVANTTNTKVIYSLRTSDGALLSYIPGLPDSLQGFTDFSSSKGYWIIALNDYDIPGIIERTGVNNLVGDFTLADFEGNIAALEYLVATVLGNSLQGNFQLSDFSGAVALQETTPEALTALNIEFPQSFQTFQYENAKGTGEIRVKGTYIPSTAPATIRVRYGTDDWQTIGTGSNGNFDLIYVGSPGQKDFQVSTTQNEALIETINTVGIGEVLLIAGDSWASGRIPMSEMIRYIVSGLDAARRFILTYLNNDEKWVQYDENVALDEPVGQSSGEVSFDRSATEARSFSAMRSHWEHMAQLLVAQLDPPRPVAFQVNARGGSTAGIASDSTTGVPSGGVSTASWLPNPNNRKDRTTLYGSMLARFQDDSGNTKCRAVLAHLGTNDVLTKEGPADNAPPTESPENFKADLIALGNAIAADFNCPLFVPILEDLSDSGRFQATTIDAGETQPRYIVFQQKMREAVAEDNNVYSGGDLSGIKPDSADGIHIVTAALGEQMAQIWANALINPLEGREAGTNAVTGSFALSDFEGTVTAEQTQEIAVRGDFVLSDFEGVVTSEEIDFNQQLLDKAVALWQFNGTDRTQFIDEKNNIVLQVMTWNNNAESVGGTINQGTGPNSIPTLNFGIDGVNFLKANQPVANLLPSATNQRTYIFWAKITQATGSNRANFFNVWEAPDNSADLRQGLFSFDVDPESGSTTDLNTVYRWFVIGLEGSTPEESTPTDIVYKATKTTNLTDWVLFVIEWDGTKTTWAERSNITIKSTTGEEYALTAPTDRADTINIRPITTDFNQLRIGNGHPRWGNRIPDGEMGPFYILNAPLTTEEYNYLFNNGIPRQVSATFVPKINVQGSFVLADFDGTVTSEQSDAPVSTLQNNLIASWSLTTNANDISGNERHLTENVEGGATPLTNQYDSNNGLSFPARVGGQNQASYLSLTGASELLTRESAPDIFVRDQFSYSFVVEFSSTIRQNWVRLWDYDDTSGGTGDGAVFTCDMTGSNSIRFFIDETNTINYSPGANELPLNTPILFVLIYNRNNNTNNGNNRQIIFTRARGRNWQSTSRNTNIALPTTATPLIIGAWQPNHPDGTGEGNDQWRVPTGPIKYVNFWNRALNLDITNSNSELNQLYNEGNFLTYPFST